MQTDTDKVNSRTPVRKNLVIAILVILLVAAAVGGFARFAWLSHRESRLMASSAKGTMEDARLQQLVFSQPNTVIRIYKQSSGPKKAILHETVYKVLPDRVLPFETMTTYLDDQAGYTFYGDHVEIKKDKSGSNVYEDAGPALSSGTRKVNYYIPSYRYKHLDQDIRQLNQFPDHVYLEAGLSFDKGYTLAEVKKMLPEGMKPTFIWLNGYDRQSKKEAYASPKNDHLIGFSLPQTKLQKQLLPLSIKNENDYIKTLKRLKYKIYSDDSTIRGAGTTGGPHSKDARTWLTERQRAGEKTVIGVSVVAKKSALEKLAKASYIRASGVGVIGN